MHFLDKSKDLAVVVTSTNWQEPPRLRHELALILSKHYNILFLQIYSQKTLRRKKKYVNSSLFVEPCGFSFPGMLRMLWRMPILHEIYYNYLLREILLHIKKHGYSSATIFNFQYDFYLISSRHKSFDKSILIINDDFVGQISYLPLNLLHTRISWQNKSILASDLVIFTSFPLKEKYIANGKRSLVLLSGHSFDLDLSKQHISISDADHISVCYLGFLNQFIAIDWLEYIASFAHIRLTCIGPIAYDHLESRICSIPTTTHIRYLEGKELQLQLLKYDVMLMPYSSSLSNIVTTAPAKLFQYLATGRPVVSSRMHNLIPLPSSFVYQSDTKEQFITNINNAFATDSRAKRLERILFSQDHTWQARQNELINAISYGAQQ